MIGRPNDLGPGRLPSSHMATIPSWTGLFNLLSRSAFPRHPHCAATCPGRHYFVKDLVSGDSQVTVAVTGGSGDTIDGNPTLMLTVPYMSYSLVSDGINRWLIID